MKKRVPLESGTTAEDAIEYVGRRMCLHLHIIIHENEGDKKKANEKVDTIKN